jgi:hypothetical protein
VGYVVAERMLPNTWIVHPQYGKCLVKYFDIGTDLLTEQPTGISAQVEKGSDWISIGFALGELVKLSRTKYEAEFEKRHTKRQSGATDPPPFWWEPFIRREAVTDPPPRWWEKFMKKSKDKPVQPNPPGGYAELADYLITGKTKTQTTDPPAEWWKPYLKTGMDRVLEAVESAIGSPEHWREEREEPVDCPFCEDAGYDPDIPGSYCNCPAGKRQKARDARPPEQRRSFRVPTVSGK